MRDKIENGLLTCTTSALKRVSVVLGVGVVRVALVEGRVRGRPVHHLLTVHHVAHGGFGTVGAARPGVRENCRVEHWMVNYAGCRSCGGKEW